MRFLNLFILLLVACLCFVAGHTVGEKSGRAAALSNIPKAHAKDPPIRETPAIEAKTEPKKTIEVPFTAEEASPELKRFAQRAEKSIITLTDTEGRTLQGELLETSEERLSVRRQIDNQVLDVPIAMLSQEDQAFAAYLFNDGVKVKEAKSQSDSEIIWEELFKGM